MIGAGILGAVLLLAGVLLAGPVYRRLTVEPPVPVPDPVIDLLWTGVFPGEGEGRYDVAVRLRNRDSARGADLLRYSFELLHASGAVLDTRSGESYIRRNEAKYIVENSLEADMLPARVRFTVTAVHWVSDEAEVSPLIVQQQSLTSGILRGTALNSAATGFGAVQVAAVLFDANGSPVRARSTEFTRLLPRESRAFELRWQQPGSAERHEVEVSTNVLDKDNYLPEERGGIQR